MDIYDTSAIELTYEEGALNYSLDIPNDAEPMTFILKAELLEDGMIAMTIDMGYGATYMYFTRAGAEEPAA